MIRSATALIVLFLCLACFAPSSGQARAQTTAGPDQSAQTHTQSPAVTPPQTIPPQTIPPQTIPPQTIPPQTTAAYTLSPERAAQAIAYARDRHILYFIEFAYGLVLLLLLLRFRIVACFRDWAEAAAGNRFAQALIFAPLLLLTLDVAALPFGAERHVLAVRFGQSVQGWSSWFWDWAKGEILSTIVASLLIWMLYALMRRSPRRWWFYVWAAMLPLLVFGVFIYPVLVEPLFFHFTPLAVQHPQLAAEIEKVVMHAGEQIPESRMYVMDASSKLNALNAYVTGLGASQRVVVWDTTIARMSTPEIALVFGHEMGHYVLHHVLQGLLFTAVLLFLFLFAGARLLARAVRRYAIPWGLRGMDDYATLPVLLLLLSVFSFVFTPIDNAFSRHIEHQADQYGLEVVHGIIPNAPEVDAHAFQVLGEVDLEEPSPSWLVKMWFYDHPPIKERIEFSRSYDPWSKGQSPKFVK